MGKNNEERPTPPRYRQGNLFEQAGGAQGHAAGGTRRMAARAELLSRLASQRTLATGIVDKITDYGNISQAYQRVKRNGGAAGVDGISLEAYARTSEASLREQREQLRTGAYRPSAVRLVEIPKPKGGKRRLGIPTVSDRIVQQSILQVLHKVYDPYFSAYSYGFRPGRSAHDAVAQAAEHVQAGKRWVVDLDLESFFDEIHHERLMSRLRKVIPDKGLVKLIHRFLRAGLMQGGLTTQRVAGTPQGGPLSPLLSNIVLDELDRELEKRGLSFVRYADDCNVFVGSRRAAERVMKSLSRFIEGKLKLKVNRVKSGIRRCDRVKFLGHTVEQNGRIRIADESIKRFKVKLRATTKRNRGIPFDRLLKEVGRLTQGWAVYYRRCNTWRGVFRYLDGWLRKRLRCYALKQHQRRYPTYRYLRKLGLTEGQAWHAVMYRQWWRRANYPAVRQAMGIQWFAQQGLRSLAEIQRG